MASSSNDKDAFPPERWPRAAPHERTGETVEAVAQYLADMTGQLESMARAAQLELVAYLLSMARTEADAIARTWPNDRKPR